MANESGEAALELLSGVVGGSGLADSGSGVVLCSGGADSAGLAAGLARALGPDRILALHIDYGLRPDSSLDADRCRSLCAELGVELVVEHARLPERGNLQALAREARYEAAESLRRERGLDWIATGHTRTDLAETVLYRLAASPGRRALLGLRARRGTVVRPLLGVGRAELRGWVSAAGLPFRDDSTNELPVFARNRIRNEVLPVLTDLAPAAEATIAETHAELAEEAEVLDGLAAAALAEAGAGSSGEIDAGSLARLHPAIARLALRALAEQGLGRPVSLSRSRAREIVRLAGQPEGGLVELGGGAEARIEHGRVRFGAGADQPAAEASLGVPGRCVFGDWELVAELAGPGAGRPSLTSPQMELAALERELVVRPWRDGDRMRPLGLGGSKSLQDLFTDRKVPRSARRSVPVVTSGGRVAWVAGVAVSEEFAARPGGGDAVVLRARARRARGADPALPA
jgi:tRNA(Ile)-lysidine synthase